MSGFAWVTLATNDSYSLGALVLAHSLRRVNTAHQLAILITPGVSEAMRTQLGAVYDLVKVVDVLDSRDEANLTLLARPELGITFTKLHCWRLTQFNKCVFLDADTLVLQNCDELFEREELSAAPDAGWPDCFNSGVFVFRPSNDTFKKLMDFAVVHGSFDGGDQGLLNLFYKDWATKDISKHLPFIYNMCSTSTYSYLPAFKQFGVDLKIIHFIGSAKPWLQVFDTETGLARVSGESHSIGSFIQLWWDLFCTYVHKSLSTEMTQHRLSSCYEFTSSSATTSTYYPDPSSSSPPKSNPRIRSPPPYLEPINDCDNSTYVFTDPWDDFTENIFSDNCSQQNYNSCPNYSDINNEINTTDNHSVHSYHSNINNFSTNNYDNCQSDSNFINNNYNQNPETFNPCTETVIVNWHDNKSDDGNISGGGNLDLWNRPTKRNSFLQPERRISVPSIADVPPSQNQHACPSISAPSPPPSSVGLYQEETDEIHLHCKIDPNPDGGLAGALAAVELGSPITAEQSALQDHLRRQGWEQGNIDYMGRDSFDNIWKKISETLNIGETTVQDTESSSAVTSFQDLTFKPVESQISNLDEPSPTVSISGTQPVLTSPEASSEITPAESVPASLSVILPKSLPTNVPSSTIATSPETALFTPPVTPSPPIAAPSTPLSSPPVSSSAMPGSNIQIQSPSVTPTKLITPPRSPVTPPSSPKTEELKKPVQPSTPIVTSPTPPTSPPVDPFDTPLPTKLNVETETPETPPAGTQPTTSPGSTDEPPIPPKRKGAKSSQEQTSKTQSKGGKQAVKGKK